MVMPVMTDTPHHHMTTTQKGFLVMRGLEFEQQSQRWLTDEDREAAGTTQHQRHDERDEERNVEGGA